MRMYVMTAFDPKQTLRKVYYTIVPRQQILASCVNARVWEIRLNALDCLAPAGAAPGDYERANAESN